MNKTNIANKVFEKYNVDVALVFAKGHAIVSEYKGNGSTNYIFEDGSILVFDTNNCGMFVSHKVLTQDELNEELEAASYPGHEPENFGCQG